MPKINTEPFEIPETRHGDLALNIANGVICRIIEPGSKLDRAWVQMGAEDRIDLIHDASLFVEECLERFE